MSFNAPDVWVAMRSCSAARGSRRLLRRAHHASLALHQVRVQPAAPLAGGHSVTSPMPGLVFKIGVAIGQQVAKDQELLVLEAMKMESPVYAPCAGTIASILVKEGDAVSEGQVLIQLS